MSVAGLYLYDIVRLAETLSKEFGTLPYERFAADEKKIESAVRRLVIMEERCTWLPRHVRHQFIPIDWRLTTGRWDQKAGRHVGIDMKGLWETIVQKLPEIGRKADELLRKDESDSRH